MRSKDAGQLTTAELAELKKGFDLAYYLHPEAMIALLVTVSAWKAATVFGLASPKYVPKGFKRSLLKQDAFQYCLYDVSDGWEINQEGRTPRPPRYVPTHEDHLIRYIKQLVWKTMDRQSHYVAAGLGCLLYRYPPARIRDVVAHFLQESPDIGRILETPILDKWLTPRFRNAGLCQDDSRTLRTRSPDPHEPQLVAEALQRFTLWNSPHIPVPPAKPAAGCTEGEATKWGEARETWRAARSDWGWFHALIDPGCVGLSRLIQAFNEELVGTTTVPLEDPEKQLRIPLFTHAPPPNQTAPDRRQPPPFSDYLPTIELLLAGLEHRMTHYRFGRLRILVDGEERQHFGPETRASEPFRLPLEASSLKVVGEDDEGEILLAMFLLPELAADAGECQLAVPLEDGRTIVLRLSPEVEAGAVIALRLQVAYEALEPQMVSKPALADRLADQLGRVARGLREVVSSAPWFLPLAGVPVGAADIPPQENVFQLDEGFIKVTCQWWAAAQGQPATVWLEWKTDTLLPGDLWVRFTQRDNTSAILAERPLGNAFRGECSWFASELGFDPMHVPWAMILLVKASQV